MTGRAAPDGRRRVLVTGWPCLVPAAEVSPSRLQRELDWCLSGTGRRPATERGAGSLAAVRSPGGPLDSLLTLLD